MDLKKLIELRHYLHKNPELSGHEWNTLKTIRAYMEELRPDAIVEVGKTGLLVSFGNKNAKKSVLFRADMDALPIQEINQFAYASQSPGVAHKCGHDGHCTILCGLAEWLSAHRPSHMMAHLVFQPAEENGEGAKAILADQNYTIVPDFVFALHNIPGYVKNQVIVKEGSFTAAARSIVLKLDGKTSHAAEPENGINPALAIAEITQAFDALSQPDITKDDFFLSTPVFIEMGSRAYGTSAGQASMGTTFRSWNNETMQSKSGQAEQLAQDICGKYKVGASISWTEEFSSNQNDAQAVQYVREVAQLHGMDICYRNEPFKWGEDFGLFTERYNGAMFGIGAGPDCPALHNADYDFPDDIIGTGINLFVGIVRQIDQ